MVTGLMVMLTDAEGLTLTASGDSAVGDIGLLSLAGWLDGVGVSAHRVDRLGDGTLTAVSRRTGRTLTITGRSRCASAEAAIVHARELAGMLSYGVGTLSVTQAGEMLTSHVRLDGAPKVSDRWHMLRRVDWEFPLHADDPHLYGPPQSAHLIQSGTGVGMRFPMFAEADGGVMSFGTAVMQDAPLSNPGNATAYPTYVVTGDLPSGFTLAQGDGLVRYDASCTSDAPVTVDMSGSVTVCGLDRTWLCGVARWAGVQPGETVHPMFSAPQGGGWAEATIYPTWI